MKYCKICGTLLEDTHEHCIRCGADVTIAENVSMYPIEVMESLEENNKRKKASGKIVAMIIGLVVALMALILFFLNNPGGMSKKEPVQTPQAQTPAPAEEDAETAVEEVPEEEEAEPTPEPSNRAIKDDKGTYYDYVAEKDDAGNVVFTALVPEDLKKREFYKNYEEYCDRYPFNVNFTASSEDNAVRFTYLSPKRLWYKLSETGKGRTNESDITHYRTYFKYDGDRSYLDPLLQQSYPGAKFEIKNEYDVSETTVSKLEELAKSKNKELFGDIGDYAHIGENTSYANMDYEFSAKVYEYEITLKDKNMLFCKYYVPSMALNLSYANGDTNDRGSVTEWYNFAIVCLESGNEDELDDYAEAFDVFIANALPTDLFMFINESYSAEIIKAVAEEGSPEPLDKSRLEKYGSLYKPDTKLDDFDTKVMEVLRSPGKVEFKGENIAVYSSDKNKAAFFDKDKNKVYLTPADNEYPGDSFEELTGNGVPASDDAGSDADTAEAGDEAAQDADAGVAGVE
ncbi:MAG: hypothetical protein K6F87_09175 [Lachnospiraceae bacterium]|nr:hypothetical protein [Lachnospiraceae bacterium]